MPTLVNARGAMEYAEAGTGFPLLVLHGTPGGCDQGLALAGLLHVEARVIAPSRPGYLRTPIDTGRTPAEQADALIVLLDDLGVDRAVVLGVSGGGMAAVQLAVRHPHRVARLVLWQAVTGPIAFDVRALVHGPLSRRPISALMVAAVRYLPRLVLPRAAARDARTVAAVQALAATTFPIEPRREGTANDAFQASHLDTGRLATIRVPTLLVHGTADRNVPFAQSRQAAAAIPGARLVTIEGGDHMRTLADPAALGEVASFIADVTPNRHAVNPGDPHGRLPGQDARH